MKASDPVPKTVKPRRTKYRHYEIVAIRSGITLDECGSVSTSVRLTEELPTRNCTAIVRLGVADYVAELDSVYHDNPAWQWRASALEREIVFPNQTRLATRVSTVVHFFGWKGGNYHLALDPVTFYGRSLDDIYPGNDPVIVRLLKWATELRNWCRENNLLVKPTNGSLASQLLRDGHFYPRDRRKVPTEINARCRDYLPGNHYHLRIIPDPTQEFRAHYLDQKRAHHYHAEHTPLPDSNSLHAYGRFLDLGNIVFPDTWPEFHGLYCLYFDYPKGSPLLSLFPGITEGKPVFVWSNEIQYLRDSGFQVAGVVAAWGSKWRDMGVRRYSRWAQQQLDSHPGAHWLKPVLLSTYGVLAIKPKPMSFVFAKAKSGEPVRLHTGEHSLHGLLVQATQGRKIEPAIANVLHRGMIEAATRIESLGLADFLTYMDHNVLSVYADAVMVECNDDIPLPPLLDPWSVKATLNHLQFINQQAFTSGEMTKLPGISDKRYSRGSHKTAPKVTLYEVPSGREIRSNKRIFAQ